MHRTQSLATLTPMSTGANGHFKIFVMQGTLNVQICTQNFIFANPPAQRGGMGAQSTKQFLLGFASIVNHWIGNPCLAASPANGVKLGKGHLTKMFLLGII